MLLQSVHLFLSLQNILHQLMIFLVSMYVGNVGFCFVFILYRGILVPLKTIWLLNQSAVFDLGEKFMVLRVNTLNSGYYKEQGCISGHKPEGKNCNQGPNCGCGKKFIIALPQSLSLHCRKEPKLLGRAFLFRSFEPESKESNLPHPSVELLCSTDSYVQPHLLESGRRLWKESIDQEIDSTRDGTSKFDYCKFVRLFHDLYPLKDDLHKVKISLFLLARWRIIISKGKTLDATYYCDFNSAGSLFL
ncbi:hypothetical protein RHMOL_Rhmol05G0320400 [Rhododendron molle]|uniref:Uncharacterized protein n=1 Tax=Rhododendron molle TaxID=49168 RepID=A0ACC0NVC6_RHOML|nr:hypothetical protein RHMOL_Rhmol05G0320400 [Rhododendron molle]